MLTQWVNQTCQVEELRSRIKLKAVRERRKTMSKKKFDENIDICFASSNRIPRMVKSDVRRQYSEFWARVYNSCDYGLMINFLTTFCTVRDFVYVQSNECNETNLPARICIEGFNSVATMWYREMCKSPDIVCTTNNTTLTLRSDYTAVVKCAFKIRATRIVSEQKTFYCDETMPSSQRDYQGLRARNDRTQSIYNTAYSGEMPGSAGDEGVARAPIEHMPSAETDDAFECASTSEDSISSSCKSDSNSSTSGMNIESDPTFSPPATDDEGLDGTDERPQLRKRQRLLGGVFGGSQVKNVPKLVSSYSAEFEGYLKMHMDNCSKIFLIELVTTHQKYVTNSSTVLPAAAAATAAV